jgi:hypothetical protein
VDVGHFSVVHGYRDVQTVEEARADGPRLHARYAMKRDMIALGGLRFASSIAFDVHVHGLGYSFVECELASLGLRTRNFVFATPTEPGRIDLRIAVSVGEPGAGALLGRPIARALSRAISVLYARDVGQDFRIWEHKRYVPRPALVQGDGPIGLYRRWARQFYRDAGDVPPASRREREAWS